MTVERMWTLGAFVLGGGVMAAALTFGSGSSPHTVTRVPTSCTSAALAAATAQSKWHHVLQAHIDLENQAWDGTITLASFRHRLAGMPAVPGDVDLSSCGGTR